MDSKSSYLNLIPRPPTPSWWTSQEVRLWNESNRQHFPVRGAWLDDPFLGCWNWHGIFFSTNLAPHNWKVQNWQADFEFHCFFVNPSISVRFWEKLAKKVPRKRQQKQWPSQAKLLRERSGRRILEVAWTSKLWRVMIGRLVKWTNLTWPSG